MSRTCSCPLRRLGAASAAGLAFQALRESLASFGVEAIGAALRASTALHQLGVANPRSARVAVAPRRGSGSARGAVQRFSLGMRPHAVHATDRMSLLRIGRALKRTPEEKACRSRTHWSDVALDIAETLADPRGAGRAASPPVIMSDKPMCLRPSKAGRCAECPAVDAFGLSRRRCVISTTPEIAEVAPGRRDEWATSIDGS
jgi:hypothetical protein